MSPADELLEEFLNSQFAFNSRPTPISAGLRPKRRIALLVSTLSRCRAGKLSWKGIHVLNWAVKSPVNMQLLSSLGAGGDIPDLPIVRIEPAMDRAIDLALGCGYVTQAGGRVFQLTAQGKQAAADVEKSGALSSERALLGQIRGKVTQKQIDALLEWRLR